MRKFNNLKFHHLPKVSVIKMVTAIASIVIYRVIAVFVMFCFCNTFYCVYNNYIVFTS